MKENHQTHITGLIVEHLGYDHKPRHTTVKAEHVSSEVRLVIKQGSMEIKIPAKDWEFINEQIELTLGKKRLITSK